MMIFVKDTNISYMHHLNIFYSNITCCLIGRNNIMIQDGFIAFSCIQLYTYKTLFTQRHGHIRILLLGYNQFAEGSSTSGYKTYVLHMNETYLSLKIKYFQASFL